MINENEAQQIKVEITNNLENLNAIKVAVLLNEDTMLEEIIPELKKEKSEVLSFSSPKLNGGDRYRWIVLLNDGLQFFDQQPDDLRSAQLREFSRYEAGYRELKLIMDLAIEYRQKLADLLHMMAPGEFERGKIRYKVINLCVI